MYDKLSVVGSASFNEVAFRPREVHDASMCIDRVHPKLGLFCFAVALPSGFGTIVAAAA